MDADGGAAAATWTVWGLAIAVLGLANLAVMGFDPVPDQHAVVGTGIFVVALLAGAATQALWRQAPRWAGLAGAVAACILFFGGSALQHALGEAALYGWGGAGAASQEAPLALLAALWAAGLTAALWRAASWWPGLVAFVLLVALYVWASSWHWGWGGDEGATLFGGAVLNGAILVVFAGTGWATARAGRTPATAGPAPA